MQCSAVSMMMIVYVPGGHWMADVGGFSKTSTEGPKLEPRGKIVAILIANAIMLACWLVVQAIGYQGPQGWVGQFRPEWTTYVSFATTGLLLCGIPLFLPSFIPGFVNFIYGLTGQGGRDESLANKILLDDGNIISKGVRVAVTIATYLHATALIMTTGGIRSSPFSQIPIAVVLLAPIIMTEIKPQLVNLGFGVVYVVVIFLLSNSSFVSNLPSHLINGNRQDVQIKGWVEPAVTIVVLLVSLGLTILRAYGPTRQTPPAST
jgi:hypothetical protein